MEKNPKEQESNDKAGKGVEQPSTPVTRESIEKAKEVRRQIVEEKQIVKK